MFHEGDRVEQRDNLGHHGRQGRVVRIDHDVLHIEWEDGHESSFIPGPGSLAVLTPKLETAGLRRKGRSA